MNILSTSLCPWREFGHWNDMDRLDYWKHGRTRCSHSVWITEETAICAAKAVVVLMLILHRLSHKWPQSQMQYRNNSCIPVLHKQRSCQAAQWPTDYKMRTTKVVPADASQVRSPICQEQTAESLFSDRHGKHVKREFKSRQPTKKLVSQCPKHFREEGNTH